MGSGKDIHITSYFGIWERGFIVSWGYVDVQRIYAGAGGVRGVRGARQYGLRGACVRMGRDNGMVVHWYGVLFAPRIRHLHNRAQPRPTNYNQNNQNNHFPFSMLR